MSRTTPAAVTACVVRRAAAAGVVRVMGIPMDLGQDQRGVDMGPSAVRYAGLSRRLRRLGYHVEDVGNLHVPARVSLADEALIPTMVQTCELAYHQTREAVDQGQVPLLLGGDHSIAIGTIGGVTHDRPCGIIWRV